jgi:anion-transporting  ArsA/GET3 family ATPase
MRSLVDKRLVFVAGKGGVGRTTVAASLGLAAARAGKRTIVCEVSEQERMSRAFRHEGVGYSEAELAPSLSAISIDPDRALEEWLRWQLRSGALAGLLKQSRIFHYLAAAAPGVKELVTVGKIWELAQLERKTAKAAPYDLVIVDSPATGHGLGMLRAPRTFGDVARVGPIRRQADKIHSFITDARATGVLVVALPEEMPVNETLDFGRRLHDQMGMTIDAVVVNGLFPERFTGPEAKRFESLDGRVSPEVCAALEAALSEHRRARTQRAQLRRLRREVDAPVATLPYLFESELGLDQFERLARELDRKL